MSESLFKFVSARQWRKTVEEYNGPDAEGEPTNPEGLGVTLDFNAEVEVVVTGTKPDGRQLLLAISSAAVDRDGDTIAVDGWDLKQYRKNPVVLFGHRYFSNEAPVVGRSLSEFVDKKKLKSLMEFTPQGMVPLADMLYGLYAEGYMNAASVGFVPKKWTFPEDEKRPFGIDFTEQELIEYSLVPVPANQEALVEARSKGIDTMPLKSYCEDLLDAWGDNRERNLWIPKSMLKEMRDWADPAQAEAAQVPDGLKSSPRDVMGLVTRHGDAFTRMVELGFGLKGDPPESGNTGIQTVLFDKTSWTESDAKVWLGEHDFESSKVDETDDKYRFRQFDPDACDPDSYVTLTENFPAGVSAVSCTAKMVSATSTGATDLNLIDAAPIITTTDNAAEFTGGVVAPSIAIIPASAPTPYPEPTPEPEPTQEDEEIQAELDAEDAGEPEPDEEVISLSDETVSLLEEVGYDLDNLDAIGDDEEAFVIVDDDGGAPDQRSHSGTAAKLLAEIINEDVEAAITRALKGDKNGA
jgi:HK97 family phage prohead protease